MEAGAADLVDFDAAEGAQHRPQNALLRLQVHGLLRHTEPLGLDVLQVALRGRAALDHRCQLTLVACQQLLKVGIQHQLLAQHQQGEVHLIDAMAYAVEADLRLCCLQLALLAGNRLLAPDGTAVIHRLADVDAYAVLILAQTLHVDAHLLIDGLHLVGP